MKQPDWRRITAGAVQTSSVEKKALAKQSHAFNLNNRKFKVRRHLYTMKRSDDEQEIFPTVSLT